MTTIKLIINDTKTLYKVESDNSSYMIFSVQDIKDITNRIVENNISSGDINIQVETSIGVYQYRNIEDVDFEKLIEEDIQYILLNARVNEYNKEVGYLKISVRLSKQFGSKVKIESVDETIARGVCSKITAIIDKNEVSYSGLIKSIQNFDWVCLLLMGFSILLVNLFNDIGVRYHYLYAILGLATFVYILTILNKSGVIHKIKFVCVKNYAKWNYYFNNPNFWQHLVNTIISSIITFLLTTFLYTK